MRFSTRRRPYFSHDAIFEKAFEFEQVPLVPDDIGPEQAFELLEMLEEAKPTLLLLPAEPGATLANALHVDLDVGSSLRPVDAIAFEVRDGFLLGAGVLAFFEGNGCLSARLGLLFALHAAAVGM